MPKIARALTAIEIRRLQRPGLHAVGTVPGLHLQVLPPPSNARSWVLRIKIGQKRKELGLGGYPGVSLADAHESARRNRQIVREGRDPVEERSAERSALAAKAFKRMTFARAAEAYIQANEAGWKNAKHAWQWRNSLDLYVVPKIGELEIEHIGMTQVLSVLEPIWRTKTETASRLRGRMELILAWADKRLEIDRLNPARWRGHLDTQLPAPSRVSKTKHHAALPVAAMPAFMSSLRDQDGQGARALEFAILTAARSGEVRGASWGEIDLRNKVWTVPAERMKGGRDHRVPLSKPALHLLSTVPRIDGVPVVFQGMRGGALSDMSLVAVCRRMSVDCVPHGFRSTFRDWCAENTNVAREVAEMALAHAVGNEVEAAYRRSDLFEKRRALMEDWAAFCQEGIATGRRKKRIADAGARPAL